MFYSQIFRNFYTSLDELNKDLLINNKFPILYIKALKLLTLGVEDYQKKNQLPLIYRMAFADREKKADEKGILSCCSEILRHYGFSKDFPLISEDVDHEDITETMFLFHYVYKGEVEYSDISDGYKGLMTEMQFRHIVYGHDITFYVFRPLRVANDF